MRRCGRSCGNGTGRSGGPQVGRWADCGAYCAALDANYTAKPRADALDKSLIRSPDISGSSEEDPDPLAASIEGETSSPPSPLAQRMRASTSAGPSGASGSAEVVALKEELARLRHDL